MSRRSRLSTLSALSGLSATGKSNADELYQYSLRVAYLAYLTSVRQLAIKNDETINNSSSTSNLHASSSTHSKSNHSAQHRPHLRHQAETWTNTIFSIADVFKDGSGSSKSEKSVKFPKDLVKALKFRIEAIAKGTDKNYQDLLLRSTFGVFYGTYTQDYYLKQLKENRNIEALILLFVTTATGVLRKRLEGDEWKIHLNSQVGVFVTIIRDCLRSKELKNVPQELMTRLDSYASKLAPASSSSHEPSSSNTDSRKLPSPSSTALTSPAEGSSSSPWSISHSIHDMPTVKTIGSLFAISDSQLQKDLNNIRKNCSEKAAFDDFKLCIANIAQQCRFPGRRADFDSDDGYREWRTKELAQIQHAMLQMIRANPDLARSKSYSTPNSNPIPQDDFVLVGTTSRDTESSPSTLTRDHTSGFDSGSSLGYFANSGENGSQRNSLLRPESVSSSGNLLASDLHQQDSINQVLEWDENLDGERGEDDCGFSYSAEELSTTQFVYIPPNPILQYKALMDQCLDFDLESMKSLAEDEEVSLKILSTRHLDLLEQCAFRWRLMTPFQVAVFFSAICRRFEEEEIPIIDCVTEALTDVFRVMEELKFDGWATRDKMIMKKTMSSLFDTLLRRVYEALELVLESNSCEDLPNALECLISIYESEPFKMITDLDQRFREFTEAISELYDRLYTFKSTEAFSAERPNDIVPFLDLTAWINTGSNRINKKFKQPVLDRIDLVAIYLAKLCQNLVQDLDAMKQILIPPPPPSLNPHLPPGSVINPTDSPIFNDADVLDLYRALIELEKKHNMCNPNAPLVIPIDEWFFPYVQNWLEAAEKKTSEWVQSAIKADKFSPEGNDSHSSSIIDLMDSCCSAVDFIQKLKWPNEYHNAKFMTKLSRIISKSIEQYSGIIEESFVEEMFPKASTDADREANRSAIWTRARLVVQGDKKPEAFQFQESSCVKLNNVEAARVLLDKMYNTIDADNVARIIHEYEPAPTGQSVLSASSYLFTVKVVMAEGLVGADGHVHKMDPFLTLSDERGNRVAKTRTVYESASPTWNETFDISVKSSLWLAATIYKRNLMEKHDYIGRAFLHLNPKEFNDFLAHDLLLDLDTRGRVLLRVSMEGEKDDVQFHFGRAFRSLKRAETDMVRMIIDKISPVIRYYLSHSTLKKLVSTPGLMMKGIEMTKMSTKLDLDLSKVTSYGAGLWRSVANSTREQEIPLPKDEIIVSNLNNNHNNVTPVENSRIKGPKGLTDADIEAAIADLFEYLDQCMSTLRNSLSEKAGQLVMAKLWKEILSIIDSLLLPPLSDQPSEMRALSGKEVDIVLKWLKFLTNFFHADGEGVPIEDLHNQKYKEIWSIGFFYDQHTDSLMEECVRAMQQQLRKETTTNQSVSRNKSVYQQRNLGTIRKRKADKKKLDHETISSELIMRILRLRPGTSDFLQQQISTMVSVNAQQKSQASSASQRAAKNNGAGLSRRNLSSNHHHHHPAPPLPHSALATIASSSSTPSVPSPAPPASDLHHRSSGSRLYGS
ncbi:hypothetical protein PGT21_028734 [Puccinia graminis f. sp. tritici]|uniref:C2 domain-containing protein n=1 Tax=Puccinia graminis f. sp. tritici TaxID=56615 RepID=A0A5B0PWB8_PUCGR|nr:hypothetical protein PGTUg99_007568 [Puccinia graminis f. sp. tritici]KAA1104639.1 hypothetical protein PGT21_028734 [Puccinia graminis f. sp. tritici]